jgi:hypothetical protein
MSFIVLQALPIDVEKNVMVYLILMDQRFSMFFLKFYLYL